MRSGLRRPATALVLTCTLSFGGLLAAGGARAAAGPPDPPSTLQVHSKRVDALLARMTLDEKLVLLSGTDEDPKTKTYAAGYLPGIPRLGIPSLRLADGPPGVATKDVSSGMTSTMGVAATWDTGVAQANGTTIGRDARALGQDVVLEPFVNIDRDPTTGRGWNTFGEDPLLTGAIGASEITGIQNQGVMAQVKHFIAYDGASGNVVVDQQTLHEIYEKPFADAVDAGVSSVMCSYNKVNGTSACGNADTLNGDLKRELGFKGFVTSDWGAVHATSDVHNGLDMEMPGTGLGGGITPYLTPVKVKAALAAKKVTTRDIDAAVSRILYEYEQFGLLDGHQKHTVTPESITRNAAVIRRTATDAAVLLKNTGNTLPLSSASLRNLALIGPGAGQTIATGGGGESSTGRADRWIGTVDTLKKAVPTANITYAAGNDLTGTPVPASALSHEGQPGLLRTTGSTTSVDRQVNFTKARGTALPAGSTHTWTGTLTAPEKGEYWINFGELGTTGTVTIDGKAVVTSDGFAGMGPRYGTVKAGDTGVLPTTDGLNNKRAQVSLTAGAHTLSITQTPDVSGQPVQVHLFWVTPSQQTANRAAAISAAKKATTAVVFAYTTNSGNLSTALPEGQDKFIADVAKVNPNTVVVLQSNAPVALPWLSSVKSVLQGWFPGDEGGWAFADLLTGAANPAGHLPFTWPAKATQGVASDPEHPERSSKGVNPGTTTPCTATASGPGAVPDCETRYSEGLNVGYRWYDQQNLTPLFPFGYGLSYSSFRYGKVAAKQSGGKLKVSFTVTNTGRRSGDTVAQVYLGAPSVHPKGVQFASKALSAFDRVSLRAGQSRRVTLTVDQRELSYWSGSWKVATGKRTVSVGDSSRNLPARTKVTIH